MRKEIKWVKSEFGWEAQVNGESLAYIWKTSGPSKWYLEYPRQYFYHLKDAKIAAINRINENR